MSLADGGCTNKHEIYTSTISSTLAPLRVTLVSVPGMIQALYTTRSVLEQAMQCRHVLMKVIKVRRSYEFARCYCCSCSLQHVQGQHGNTAALFFFIISTFFFLAPACSTMERAIPWPRTWTQKIYQYILLCTSTQKPGVTSGLLAGNVYATCPGPLRVSTVVLVRYASTEQLKHPYRAYTHIHTNTNLSLLLRVL